MRTSTFIILSFILFAAPGYSADWGLGPIADSESTGLSIQRQSDIHNAIHVSLHFFDEESASMGIDYQRFFYPTLNVLNTHEARLSFYSGGGIHGTNEKQTKSEEHYYLRLPLGLQINFGSIRTQLFGEGSALIGHLPETKMKPNGRVGVRAVF